MTRSRTPEWMGKNGKLTPSEIKEFLAEPMVARIATIDENGMPYVTPVWQQWDGEAFWIVPRERSEWVAHIKKNPNVGVSCAQDSGTYKRITAQGRAEIVFGPAPMQGQCLEVANRMALRFLGEHGPEYLVPTYDRRFARRQDRPFGADDPVARIPRPEHRQGRGRGTPAAWLWSQTPRRTSDGVA